MATPTQVVEAAGSVVGGAGYRWTRRQYDQMIEAGIFDEDDRVELIEGEILAMSPQNSLHATGGTLLAEALYASYPDGHTVRTQLPLVFDPDSEPEPDLAVVAGEPRDYRDAHPTAAVLVVEVADASLAKDRTQKVRLYAARGIPEYWILNVSDACLEVYRDPSGETYAMKTTLYSGDRIRPPQGSGSIAVADVLP